MALIRVKKLLLRTYIGFNPEEIANKQDVLINIEIEADIPEEALLVDEPEGIYNYKTITKQVISKFIQFPFIHIIMQRICF